MPCNRDSFLSKQNKSKAKKQYEVIINVTSVITTGFSSTFRFHTSISIPIHWKRSEVQKAHLARPNTRKKFAAIEEYPRNKAEEKHCPSP